MRLIRGWDGRAGAVKGGLVVCREGWWCVGRVGAAKGRVGAVKGRVGGVKGRLGAVKGGLVL